MAHIKCRYEKFYCGAAVRFSYYRRPCDPEKGDADACDRASLELDSWGNGVCEYGYYAPAEFEKTAKSYEICFGERNPILRIGKEYYGEITYLEIDGRVLIGGDQNA